MSGSGPFNDALLIGSMIVLGAIWLGAMYMLVTGCIHQSKLDDDERKAQNDRRHR